MCVIAGFCVTWTKDIAHAAIADPDASRVYLQYFEELKEQKELMFAVGFAVYGFYRLRKTGRGAASPAD